MSALSPEARARLEAWLARYQSCADSEHMRIPGDDSPWGPTFGDLRAMLADSDALSASEAADRAVVVAMEAAKSALETVTRERDEAVEDMARTINDYFDQNAELAVACHARDEARKTNAALNRRVQAAESAARHFSKIEARITERKRGKPLGRIEGAYAIAAAETIADALRAQVAKLRDGISHLASQECRQSYLHETRPCARGDCGPCIAMKLLRSTAPEPREDGGSDEAVRDV